MSVAFRRDSTATIAAITGDVDMANSAWLTAAVMAGIDAEASALVLDPVSRTTLLHLVARHLFRGVLPCSRS